MTSMVSSKCSIIFYSFSFDHRDAIIYNQQFSFVESNVLGLILHAPAKRHLWKWRFYLKTGDEMQFPVSSSFPLN